MTTKNKFGSAFSAIRASEEPEASPELASAEAPAQEAPATVAPPRTIRRARAGERARVAVPERRGPGRPPGKRSDPEYRQVTGLIRKDVHTAVLKQMLDEGRSRDMGALMEELFERYYLKTKRRNNGAA